MTKRTPARALAAEDSRDAALLQTARLDEVLTLMSRQQDTVLTRTLVAFDGDKRLLTVEGQAQWQVVVEEQTFTRGQEKKTAVGYADLQISFTENGTFRRSKRLMIICRPELVSAAETLRLLHRLSKREGRARLYHDEVWAIATDDDSMRDIFEGNGYKYICTKWNDLDGWGRTDRVVLPAIGESQHQEPQWVLVESDVSGVTSTITTRSKDDAITWFLQMTCLFVHAFPKNEFRVVGDDSDATLEGLRLLMCAEEDVGQEDPPWHVPVQVCKSLGLHVYEGLGGPAKAAADGGFERLGASLSRMLEGRGATLEAKEVEKLSHSWPALLYYRDTSSLMAESVERTKRALGKKRLGDADALWAETKAAQAGKVASVVVQQE